MNFKERGITVGDLLIILIVILTTTVIVKSINKGRKTALILNNQKEYVIGNPYNQKLFLKTNY